MAPMTAALQSKKKAEEEQYANDYVVNQGGQNEFKDGQDIEWEYCNYHTDRVKHFYYTTYSNLCCRVCTEVIHARPECQIVDLYETDDVQAFMAYMSDLQKGKNVFAGK